MHGAVALIVGIDRDAQRVVHRTQEAASLARHVHHVVKYERQRGVRHVELQLAPQITERSAVAREHLLDRHRFLAIAGGSLAAGEGLGRGRVVQAVGVVHAAHQRHLVHHARHVRQMLADRQTGDRGRDRFELAANFAGPVGLEIVGIEMARPAVIEHDDARLQRRQARGIDRGGGGACVEQTTEAQPKPAVPSRSTERRDSRGPRCQSLGRGSVMGSRVFGRRAGRVRLRRVALSLTHRRADLNRRKQAKSDRSLIATQMLAAAATNFCIAHGAVR